MVVDVLMVVVYGFGGWMAVLTILGGMIDDDSRGESQ